nr:hypothetical protein [Mycoplasmopsis bovis]
MKIFIDNVNCIWSKLHKTFDELINFHNKMIDEKLLICKQWATLLINNKLDEYNAELTKLLWLFEKDIKTYC